MMPSSRPTGTLMKLGLRLASWNRYSPCSRAVHALPGPVQRRRLSILNNQMLQSRPRLAGACAAQACWDPKRVRGLGLPPLVGACCSLPLGCEQPRAPGANRTSLQEDV